MEENIECYDVLYEEIDILKVDELIEIFSTKEDLIVLNSERLMDDHGRYSFVCFDSFIYSIVVRFVFYFYFIPAYG